MQAGITRLVPLETVLVDEASQIEIGDYLPMLSRFGQDIRKLAFIGDDKQRMFGFFYICEKAHSAFLSVAPYGAEEVKDLRSIFEVEHLRKNAVFLAKQCTCPLPFCLLQPRSRRARLDRMPVPIGDFISRKVYNSRLKSQHEIKERQCCRFVDVHHGKEQVSEGSFQVRTRLKR